MIAATVRTGDLLAACEMPQQTLANWVSRGYLTPTVPAPSRKAGHRYSVPQAVGVAVALEVRRTRGCAPSYVVRTISAFEYVTEDWLRAAFARGATHYAGLGPRGSPVLQPKQADDWVDVKAVYQRIKGARKG